MRTLKAIAVGAMLTMSGWTGQASAELFTGFYDFADAQYADDFTDVRRGAQINGGASDLGGTLHTALNFTGGAGPTGDTWLTKWTPGGAPGIFNGRCSTVVAANVLIHSFNNRKGAGLVGLLNDENPGDKGLALTVYDNGNTDAIQLATVDPFTGRLTPLKTFPLFARITENAWYLMAMAIKVDLAFEGHKLKVDALLFRLQDPSEPLSDPAEFIGGFRFNAPLESVGVQTAGQVGVMAAALNGVVDSSVTNWAAEEGSDGPCEE